MYIKRNKRYEPIIFDLVEENIRVLDLGEPSTTDSGYVNWDIGSCISTNSTELRTCSRNNETKVTCSSKGIIIVRNNRWYPSFGYTPVLVVTRNVFGNIMIVCDLAWFNSAPSYLTKVKKSINQIEGLNSRKNLVTMPRVEFISNFFNPISISMEDYLPEVQNVVFNEFISSEKQRLGNEIGLYLEKEPLLKDFNNFKAGDYLTCVEERCSKGRRSESGKGSGWVNGKVIKVGRIEYFESEVPEDKCIWPETGENGIYANCLRYSTEEEINEYKEKYEKKELPF